MREKREEKEESEKGELKRGGKRVRVKEGREKGEGKEGRVKVVRERLRRTNRCTYKVNKEGLRKA